MRFDDKDLLSRLADHQARLDALRVKYTAAAESVQTASQEMFQIREQYNKQYAVVSKLQMELMGLDNE